MAALLKRLSQSTPPVMPETIDRLQALRARAEVTRNVDIGRVLSDDPAATIAVFRELEQMRPGSFEQVADSAHAVSLLGAARFRQLVDTLPLVGGADDASGGIAAALARGAHAGRFATALANHKGMTGEAEITTAALLQDPVWLALWATAPEQASQVAAAVRAGKPLEETLQQALGEPVAELNGTLARAWGMPMLARQAIKPVAGDTRPKLGAVRLAEAVATATAAGWQHPMMAELPDRLAEFLSLSPDDATRWLHEQATDIARELSAYAYPLAGYELLLLPMAETQTAGKVTSAAKPTESHTKSKPPAERRSSPKGPAKTTRDQQTTKPSLHDTMVDIMRRIRADTGARRVLFAMLTTDRRQLRTRLVLGGQRDDALRRLDLAADGRHLFAALLKKPQSVWLNTGNAARYESLLTETLCEAIRPDNAYLMSLFIRGRALGVLYSDGDALDETGYQRFRALCNRATNALSG